MSLFFDGGDKTVFMLSFIRELQWNSNENATIEKMFQKRQKEIAAALKVWNSAYFNPYINPKCVWDFFQSNLHIHFIFRLFLYSKYLP